MRENMASVAVGPLLLTAREAARALRVSPRTLWAMTAPRGPVPCVRLGRRLHYAPADLAALVTQRRVAPRGAQ
jgi:hypothetical protein